MCRSGCLFSGNRGGGAGVDAEFFSRFAELRSADLGLVVFPAFAFSVVFFLEDAFFTAAGDLSRSAADCLVDALAVVFFLLVVHIEIGLRSFFIVCNRS
jgi:hypothetical protein